jgi:hypothetical protein
MQCLVLPLQAPSSVEFIMELVGTRSSGSPAVLRKGDLITIDGSSGKIYLGEIPTVIAGIYMRITF